MTRVRLVAIDQQTWEGSFHALAMDADSAARAQAFAGAGDRVAADRYSRLADLLEQRALTLAAEGSAESILLPTSPDWLDRVLPPPTHTWFTPADLFSIPPSDDPDATWARDSLAARQRVVEIRTGDRAVVTSPPAGIPATVAAFQPDAETQRAADRTVMRALKGAPLLPSSIPNDTLTNGLYQLAARQDGQPRGAVEVIYRDGSSGKPFPSRAIEFGLSDPVGALRVAVSLISMRHPDQDLNVHGAWLRNIEVSGRQIPHAEVDDTAYERSRGKLARLVDLAGTVAIDVYQVGLQPAVVGFYRAVADHLINAPGTVSVKPHFFRGDSYDPGALWTNR